MQNSPGGNLREGICLLRKGEMVKYELCYWKRLLTVLAACGIISESLARVGT